MSAFIDMTTGELIELQAHLIATCKRANAGMLACVSMEVGRRVPPARGDMRLAAPPAVLVDQWAVRIRSIHRLFCCGEDRASVSAMLDDIGRQLSVYSLRNLGPALPLRPARPPSSTENS